MNAVCQARTECFFAASTPLPGSVPADNARVMNVKARYDGLQLRDYLSQQHPHISLSFWQQRLEAGLLTLQGRKVTDLAMRVRAGNHLVHTVLAEVEPNVAVDVRFLYEEETFLVLHKPAPLPMHPCGRFNRNSLSALLANAFPHERLWPVHRLDADTCGLVVVAKSLPAARALAAQFEAREVKKVYLARVRGRPASAHFDCTLPLQGQGGKRQAQAGEGSRSACTSFSVLATLGEETLLLAAPDSGRTNQIRVHLAALGLPIVGDESYGGEDAFTSGRSQLCLHAFRLAFAHPETQALVHFEDAVPAWAAPQGEIATLKA